MDIALGVEGVYTRDIHEDTRDMPRLTISRWGNSLGIRLPKEALERANLREGDALLVEATARGLVLRPANRLALEELLAAISTDNLHRETETGEPVGSELW